MKHALAIALITVVASSIHAEQVADKLETQHVAVTCAGISKPYAKAIGETVETARAAAAKMGFDMPETIEVSIERKTGSGARLWNDGQNRLYLTVQSEEALSRPAISGTFMIYGFCHEVAHLAMYRAIRDHRWMTTAAAEGWAHYLGAELVDRVYAEKGEALWPDAYDYRSDGTRRLAKQLAATDPSVVTLGAKQWKDLAEIAGFEGVARLFKAWGQAQLAAEDPAPALQKALTETLKSDRLADWWKESEKLMVLKQLRSGFSLLQLDAGEVTGQPVELKHDDGRQAGRSSMAGGGHAVRFETEGDGLYLTGVSINGSRYGRQEAPQEDFHLWICDDAFNVIADFPFAYSRFNRGEAKWVKLNVKPTRVPQRFVICVGFNPTAAKGVFVGHDKEASGNSFSGLPGRRLAAFNKGDWLIRAVVDQHKATDALHEGQEKTAPP